MAIVTVSHEMGSGGSEIGTALAERLGYRYVDQDMISQAARQYGVGEEKLSQIDETKPSFVERFDVETRRYITVLQSALLDVAEQDNVIIMGRGGQVLLRGIAHVLRLRVMAPFDMRVKRVMKKMAGQMGETVDVRTTAEMVRRNDQEKFGRMRYLYDVDWSDPALYDVVLNTEKLSPDAGVELALGLLRRPELAATESARQMVRDRALASRIRTALAAHPETRKYRINVEADRGVVQLEGTAALERASEVARTVPGVVDVKAQLLEVPPIPPFVA
ncbi:MAG TPA: cytidylate kinase family protein [Methylomirabilota bacterium]|jgi:cytidylate kinase|nr:cytidylate kinase family protein [Methylomirabilota bacterium]